MRQSKWRDRTIKVLGAGMLATTCWLAAPERASAQQQAAVTQCRVDDLQHVKVGSFDYLVFSACDAFWYVTGAASKHVQHLVTMAFMTGKRVNVQCGYNLPPGSGCATGTMTLFKGGSMFSAVVAGVGGLQVIE